MEAGRGSSAKPQATPVVAPSPAPAGWLTAGPHHDRPGRGLPAPDGRTHHRTDAGIGEHFQRASVGNASPSTIWAARPPGRGHGCKHSSWGSSAAIDHPLARSAHGPPEQAELGRSSEPRIVANGAGIPGVSVESRSGFSALEGGGEFTGHWWFGIDFVPTTLGVGRPRWESLGCKAILQAGSEKRSGVWKGPPHPPTQARGARPPKTLGASTRRHFQLPTEAPPPGQPRGG